jgi:lipopolysaccharide transport system ATP-binding protein
MSDLNQQPPLLELLTVSKRFQLKTEHHRSIQDSFVQFWRRDRTPADEFWPLRDVSLTLHAGESIGILGQNGSGKSTLLKILTGVLQPTSGQVRTRGRIAALLELGAGFHPELTGRENIYLNGSVYGIGRREMQRQLNSIIDFAELGEFIDMPVKHYSSGMYVRLGFAVAIHTDPEVLIVDEVLTVGDQIFQQKCMQRILEMQAAGVAIVLVSHNLEDIRRLCQRAIWLQNGEVRANGEALDVADDYLAYTSELYYARRRAEQADEDGEPVPPANSSSSQRWGTYQAEITQVELCNRQGEPVTQFLPGESLTIRIHYIAHERVVKPTFGLAIYRHDGVHVNGPNSVNEGYQLDDIAGAGVMEYRIDHLPLNPGRFELTVAIYNRNSTTAFDHHHRMYTFEVASPRGRAEEGVVHIPATWQHKPALLPALVGEL